MKLLVVFLKIGFLMSCISQYDDVQRESSPLAGNSENAALPETHIIGTWELVRVSAITMMDSPPRGLMPLKYHFADSGKVHLIEAHARLTEITPGFPYRWQQGRLEIDLPGDSPQVLSGEMIDGNLVIVDPDRRRWTLQRMTGPDAEDRPLEPRSVAVIAMNEADMHTDPPLVVYDSGDYRKLPCEKRLIGVWEVIAYRNVPYYDLPPYGFPNEKWILGPEGKGVILDAPKTDAAAGRRFEYQLEDDHFVITYGDQAGRQALIQFNEWGHLVLTENDVAVSFKLVRKDPKDIPALPVRVVLLEPRER